MSSKRTERTARFWNRAATRYAAKPVTDEGIYARKLAITQHYLNSESHVLEIGCGTGSTALEHARHVKHVRASDISSRMIDIARAKACAAEIANVDFEICNFNDPRLSDTQYDAVLALNLLHLLADWPEAIRVCCRSLKPGGVFVTSTVCMMDDYSWLRPIAPLGLRMGLLPPISFFTRAELERVMLNSGFEIEHAWLPSSRGGLFMVARKLE